MEQQAEEIKIQARWLGDLTKVDDAMIQLCDEMYDKAQSYLKIAELKEKRQAKAPKKAEKQKEEVIPKISLQMNLHKARLSHLLTLKKLFREHGGKSPIQLDFMEKEAVVNSIQIEEDWGVLWSRSLEDAILQVESVVKIVTN